MRGARKVDGWLWRVDAEIILATMQYQTENGLSGGVAEIGLHHGRLFTALCIGLSDGEKAYGIDVFDAQHLNLDRSGKGRRAIVEKNLAKNGVDLAAVILDGRSSQDVTADDIQSWVGAVKFFSVDGGHWRDIVFSDLCLAQNTITPHGVIALDDFHHPAWPEVSLAYADWQHRASDLSPFAIGPNKIYLCRTEYHEPYKHALQSNRFLQAFLTKQYAFLGPPIPIYHTPLQPKASWRRHVKDVLKIYHPNAYAKLYALFRRRLNE
jgi:hypothetical protein